MEAKLLGVFDENNMEIDDIDDMFSTLWKKNKNGENYFAYLITKEGKRIMLSPTNYPDLLSLANDKRIFLTNIGFEYEEKEILKINLESPMRKEDAKEHKSYEEIRSIEDAISELIGCATERKNVYIEYTSDYPTTKGEVFRLYSADYPDWSKIEEYITEIENKMRDFKKDMAKKIEITERTIDEVANKLIECCSKWQNVYVEYESPYPATLGQIFRLYSADVQHTSFRKYTAQLYAKINPKNELDIYTKEQKRKEKLEKRAEKLGYPIEIVEEIDKIGEKIAEAMEQGNVKIADELTALQIELIKEAENNKKEATMLEKAQKLGIPIEVVRKIEELKEQSGKALESGNVELSDQLLQECTKLYTSAKSTDELPQQNTQKR